MMLTEMVMTQLAKESGIPVDVLGERNMYKNEIKWMQDRISFPSYIVFFSTIIVSICSITYELVFSELLRVVFGGTVTLLSAVSTAFVSPSFRKLDLREDEKEI